MQQVTRRLLLSVLLTGLARCFPDLSPRQINKLDFDPLLPLGVNSTTARVGDSVYGERDVSYFITPQGTAIVYVRSGLLILTDTTSSWGD